MWDTWRHALSRSGLLCAILIVVFSFPVFGQRRSHRWDITYSECSQTCGGGTQVRVDRCFTTGTPSVMAPVGYCNSLPTPTEPPVRSCSTQPCTMCDRTYSSLTGTLTSPYWPDKESTSGYCRLVVDIEPGKRILLAFETFELEGVDLFYPVKTEEDLCLCGVLVEVRDSGNRLNRYCGTKKPFAWVSETDRVTVEFVTPYDLVFNRFIASYTTLTTPPSCYEFIDLTGFILDPDTDLPLPQEGFLHSRNFPNPYPDNVHCEYVFHANPEHRIVLYFDEFELEPGPECEADYVRVEDLYSRRANVYCGKQHSFSWTSDSNEALLTFRTNNHQVYTGFLLAYELMDREADNVNVLSDESGVFFSPGYPSIYSVDVSVEFALRVDPRQLLVITFHDFQLERDDHDAPLPIQIVRRSTLNEYQDHYGDPYTSCVDYVKILDIFSNHEEIYCGRIPVFSYISRGNEIMLHFKTDGSMQYRGFNASYRAISRRVPTDWEIVYRVARGGETAAVDKFLFQDRGYNQYNPSARATTLTRSRNTYKHEDVTSWEDIGVRKVKIDVYSQGSIQATFRFQGEGSSLSDWFDCERMTYSGYGDLNRIECDRLVFALQESEGDTQEFEIATVMNATIDCDDDEDRRVWLDLQDVNSPRNCTYEAPENRNGEVEIINSIIFISSASTGGESATGANIAEAQVFTIWIQRDCDERVAPERGEQVLISSSGHGSRDYQNNEYCDIYMTSHPFSRLVVEFSDFELEEDECLANDHVQIENTDTGTTQTFCGRQHQVLWTTTANAAILRFRTDSVVTYNGWGASVTAERRNLEDCSAVTYHPTGNLTNPEHPNSLQEYRYYGCEYIVHAHPKDRVVFSFSSFIFQTENPPEMQIDPRTSNLNFIEVSGQLYPFSWTSDTNELAVSFHAPLPYRTYILFEASYRTLEAPQPATCQEFHNADFGGTFNWPMESLATGLQNCYIVVRTDPDENKRIQLIFRNLKMPQSDCNSYVNTIDTTTRRSDMYCQRIRLAFSWTSDANEVVIQFFHGPTFALHQVEGQYRSRERVKPQDAVVLTDQAGGSFSSPNYPLPYERDDRKEILLHATPEHLVIVVFKDFSIEGAIETSELEEESRRRRRRRSSYGNKPRASHFSRMYKRQFSDDLTLPECQYDFVTVEDVMENKETRYCGDQQPFGVAMSGNEALIRFQTDFSVEKRGFDALYAFEPRPAVADCGQLFTGNDGGLRSPAFPSNYPNGAYCRDVIQVRPTDRIVIRFQFLNLEDDPTCSKDYVEVRDVVTGRVQKYCGRKTSPFQWTSDTNLVFVTFVSDDGNSGPGYDASYSVEDRSDEPTCVHDITASSGTIHSPRFPLDYANQLNCEFNIVVDEGYGIQLTFQEFILEPPSPGGSDCPYDFVQIVDPTTANVETAEKLCGSKNPFERQVLHNELTIIFHSDFILFYKGFICDFQQISLGQNLESCNEELTGPAGYLSSPGYPGNYPDDAHCTVVITADEGYHIIIHFNDFNTEGYPGCPYDYVLVEDVLDGLSEKYCGRKKQPFSWTSQSNQVSVTFVSDDRTPSSGYYASYESVPDPEPVTSIVTGCEDTGFTEISQDSGVIQSPNYPDLYPLGVDCFVRIHLPYNFVCKITFTTFDLEHSGTCNYDFVKVTSLPDGATEKFCGSLPPFTWRSQSATCELHFRSDDYVKAGGYRADFTAIEVGHYGQYNPAPPQPQVPYHPAPYAPPEPQQPAPYQPYQPPEPQVPQPYALPEPQQPAPYQPYAPPEPQKPAPYQPYQPPEPQVPQPYAPPEPQQPAPYQPYAPPEPQKPAPYEPYQPPEPQVPQPYAPPEPQKPAPYQPYQPPEPQVPQPYAPPEPQVPQPYAPPEPQVPLPYAPPEPQVPLPYAPPEPQVPQPYAPPEPQVPQPYAPPEPQVPQPYAPPEPQQPAPYQPYQPPEPQVPQPYAPPEPQQPAPYQLYQPPEPQVPQPYAPPEPQQPVPYQPPEPNAQPASECLQTLHAQQGVEGAFASPGWPERYPLNVHCVTTIIASKSNRRIRISFSTFQLEAEDCGFDYVQISETVPTGLPDRLCGTLQPFLYESKTNQVTISLVSDAYVTKQGFLATFSEI